MKNFMYIFFGMLFLSSPLFGTFHFYSFFSRAKEATNLVGQSNAPLIVEGETFFEQSEENNSTASNSYGLLGIFAMPINLHTPLGVSAEVYANWQKELRASAQRGAILNHEMTNYALEGAAQINQERARAAQAGTVDPQADKRAKYVVWTTLYALSHSAGWPANAYSRACREGNTEECGKLIETLYKLNQFERWDQKNNPYRNE